MSDRSEQLLAGAAARSLSSAEQHELLELLRNSEALRRVAARDRVVARWLLESRKPSLDADLVLRALARQSTDLSTRTMERLNSAGRHSPVSTARPDSILAAFHGWLTRALGWSGVAVSVAVTLAVVAAGWWAARRAPTPRLEVGRISSIVGLPSLRSTGSARPATAASNALVHLGDRLETGDADRAEIRFHDGTTLRLAFNTTVEFPRTTHDQRPTTNVLLRPSEIRLLQGHVWTQVQKLTNALPYAIRTDAATAIARGTEFGVKLQRLGTTATNSPFATRDSRFATVLSVKEGIVDFTNALGSVRATAMMESTATANSAPTEPKRLTALPLAGPARAGDWPILTAPLTASVAAERLLPGGGWVGMVLRTFTNTPIGSALAGATPSPEVRVARVERGSPADLAGIRPGDQLLAVNQRPVGTAAEIEQSILAILDARLNLRLRRGEQEVLAEITVGDRPSHLPGPTLSPKQQEQLVDVTRRLLTGNGASAEADIGRLRDPAVRAAAENNLGVRCETEDRLGPAIRAYGRAVRADPGVPLYRFNLGLALRLMGSYERAAEELQEAVRLAPRSTAARQRFAEIQSLLGRDTHALALTEEALKDDPSSHGLWELKAQLLWRQQRFGDARDAASQAIQLEPSCPVAHAYLGGVHQDQAQLEAASQAYERTLELAPFEPSIHFRLGQVSHARGQTPEALGHFRRAIELQPTFTEAHIQLGSLLIERGELSEAERTLRTACGLVPDSSELHNNLGEALRNQGRSDEAMSCFQRAIQLDPENLAPLNNLGILHAMRREFSQAGKALRTVADRSPGMRVPALLNLAMAISSQGRPHDAEAIYREALTVAPNDPTVWNHLAFFLAEQRRHLDEALDLARRALRTAPDNASFLDTLGWVLAQRGELEAAEQTLTRAVELGGSSPDGPEIRDHLKRVQDQKSRAPAPPNIP